MSKAILIGFIITYIILGLLGLAAHALLSLNHGGIFTGVLVLLILLVCYAIFHIWKIYITYTKGNTKTSGFFIDSVGIAFFLLISIIILISSWSALRPYYKTYFNKNIAEGASLVSISDSLILSSQGNPVGIRLQYTMKFSYFPLYNLYLLLGEDGYNYYDYDITSTNFYTLKSDINPWLIDHKLSTDTYTFTRDLFPNFIKPISGISTDQTKDFFGIYSFIDQGYTSSPDGYAYMSLQSCLDIEKWLKFNNKYLDELNTSKQLDFTINHHIKGLTKNMYNLHDFYDTTIKEGLTPCTGNESRHNGFNLSFR